MKKSIIALWIAWMLAWSPNAHAQLKTLKTLRNEELIETVSQDSVSWPQRTKVVSYGKEKEKLEIKNLKNRIMSSKEIQEILKNLNIKPEDARNSLDSILEYPENRNGFEAILKKEDLQKKIELQTKIQEYDSEVLAKRLDEISEKQTRAWISDHMRDIGRAWIIFLLILILKNQKTQQYNIDKALEELDDLLSKRPII